MSIRTRNSVTIAPQREPDEIASSVRSRPPELGSLAVAVRAALELACAEESRIQVTVRGDPTAGRPVRLVEGAVRAFRECRDGRERVVLAISEDAEQIVPIDMIVRVVTTP